MEYKKMNGAFCLRVDKGERVVESILSLCRKEGVGGGHFQGIGACGSAELATYLPERQDFVRHTLSGMLEMVSLMGNISVGQDGQPFAHSHALFSYLDDVGNLRTAAGHLQEAQVSYTAEIVLTPAGEDIRRKFDQAAGIEVWDLA